MVNMYPCWICLCKIWL